MTTTPDDAAMQDDVKIIEAIIIREWTLNAGLKGATFGSVARETARHIAEYTRATPHAEAVRVLHAALKRFTDEIPTGWDDDHHPFSDEVDQAYKAQAHPAVVAAMSSADDA